MPPAAAVMAMPVVVSMTATASPQPRFVEPDDDRDDNSQHEQRPHDLLPVLMIRC
jgi:hypothetical protein